jgi:hypothetical protein
MSTVYHPQSDGQTKHVKQFMETFLCCFVNACPYKWIKWLSLAEYWYNTSFHSALGHSPFEVLYFHSPNHFRLTAVDACVKFDLAAWLVDRSVMLDLVKPHLSRLNRVWKSKLTRGAFFRGDHVA